MMASIASTSFKAFCFSLSDREGSLTLVSDNGSKRGHEHRTNGQLQHWNLLQGVDLVVRQAKNLSTPRTCILELWGAGREQGAPCKQRNKLLHQAAQASVPRIWRQDVAHLPHRTAKRLLKVSKACGTGHVPGGQPAS